jgi:hypothetical protein
MVTHVLEWLGSIGGLTTATIAVLSRTKPSIRTWGEFGVSWGRRPETTLQNDSPDSTQT